MRALPLLAGLALAALAPAATAGHGYAFDVPPGPLCGPLGGMACWGAWANVDPERYRSCVWTGGGAVNCASPLCTADWPPSWCGNEAASFGVRP